jgi:hypothetical protein
MERGRERAVPAVAEDDDLEEHSPARRHGRGRRIWSADGADSDRVGACGRGADTATRSGGRGRGPEVGRTDGMGSSASCSEVIRVGIGALCSALFSCWLGRSRVFFCRVPLPLCLIALRSPSPSS